jgi:periplasmic divalent cation tolerance protein
MATKNSCNLAGKKHQALPWIGWTTIDSSEAAHHLARMAVESSLVACAQVDGPIFSYYRWQGKLESAQEYRITFKFSAKNVEALRGWILRNHTYQNPQWVAVCAADTTEEYTRWIERGE